MFFLVNIAKCLRIPVLKNICERLFECFPTWVNNIMSNIGIEEDIFSKTKTKKNHSKFCYNQSQKIVAQPFFFLKNMSPPPPFIRLIHCWESVKNRLELLWCLKRKKSTLKLGDEGFCHNFCEWLSVSQKLSWQGFNFADAFKLF